MKDGLRGDGRRANELRKISIDIGVTHNTTVDGSCLYQQGNTKVMASVIGPRELSTSRQRASARDTGAIDTRMSIDVIYNVLPFAAAERRAHSKSDKRLSEIALTIKQTFETTLMTELYPNSHITIVIDVLHNDGAVHSAAINAATIALLHTGIPMRELVLSCSIGMDDNNIAVVDLNSNERYSERAEMTIAISPVTNKVLLLQLDSGLRVPVQQIQLMLLLAAKTITSIHEFVRENITEHMQKLIHARNAS